jgi:hypothetical protein
MSTYHPDSSHHPTRKIVGRRKKTGRDVICKICQAVYVPAQTHMQLAHSPQSVVESAFMSMCHFCFRCRRPACPSCWDDIHGICGACIVEAQLSFRSSTPPLDGVIFPPIQHVQEARVHILTPSLVCVRPGRFQHAPLPIEAQTTIFMQTLSDQPIYDPSKAHLSQKVSTSSSVPPSETETLSGPTKNARRATLNGSSSPFLRSSMPKSLPDIENIATRPEKRGVERKEKNSVAQSQPSRAIDMADVVTRPEKGRVDKTGEDRKTARQGRFQRAVTEILLLIALLIIILIAGALFSPNVNDGIAHLLHVDIRAEIAYLLLLIQHLF